MKQKISPKKTASEIDRNPQIYVGKTSKIWNSCNNCMGHQLSATGFMNEEIIEAPLSVLPNSLRNIPGIFEVHIQGYATPIQITPSLSATGEFAVIRLDGKIKTYNYVYGVSDSNWVYFAGPWKKFPAHHINLGESVALTKVFGNNAIVLKNELGSS